MTDQHNNDVPVNADPGMQWYVLQVASGKEISVRDSLLRFIENSDEPMAAMFGEITVPTEEVIEMRAGKKHTTTRRFFPGYVLVQMVMSDDAWHFVKSVPGVSKFIGGKNAQPVALSEAEVDRILRRVETGEQRPQPKTLYEVGEMLRVIDGPFKDFDGTVEEINYDKSRLKVSVSIFGRSTPVDLSFNQVEKM